MAMPQLNLEGFKIIDNVDHALIIDEVSEQQYRLDSNDALILRCIDGTKSLSTIQEELTQLLHFKVPSEVLWKAMDTLSDIGVLQERATPPTGGQITSRRGFLSLISVTATVASIATPQLAFGDPGQAEEQNNKNLAAGESNAKQAAEQNAKNPAGAEQNNKDLAAGESNDKQAAAEQSSKNLTPGEAHDKQTAAAEQNNKNLAAGESNDKQAAEQNAKNPAGAEQNNKDLAAGESNVKQAAEQNNKNLAAGESNDKQAAEQSEQNAKGEVGGKEASLKNGSTGGNPMSVPAPPGITLLGLGLAALTLLNRRKEASAKENLPDHDNTDDDPS